KDGAIEFSFTALTFVGAIGGAERLPTPRVLPITPPGKIGPAQVSRSPRRCDRPVVTLRPKVRHVWSDVVGGGPLRRPPHVLILAARAVLPGADTPMVTHPIVSPSPHPGRSAATAGHAP